MAVEKSAESVKNQYALIVVSDFYTGLNWMVPEEHLCSDKYKTGSHRILASSGRVY